MDISILLPSRGRPDSLLKSIESLIGNAHNRYKIEILIAADEDDQATRNFMDKYGMNGIVCERRGYHRIHEYINELATMSIGERWLMFWNDDAIMKTRGWDTIFKQADHEGPRGGLRVLRTQTNYHNDELNIFPAMSRGLYELLGYYSPTNHTDSYLTDIAVATDILIYVPVHIYHDRFDLTGGHNDQTYHDSKIGYRTSEYYGREIQSILRSDADKIQHALKCKVENNV